MSYNSIAKHLSVHRSTIIRELRRNKGKCGYRYKQAHRLALDRCHSSRSILRKITSKIICIIEEKLCNYQWSPEQISGCLKQI